MTDARYHEIRRNVEKLFTCGMTDSSIDVIAECLNEINRLRSIVGEPETATGAKPATDEPTVSVLFAITGDGWRTTVRMPDGTRHRRRMRADPPGYYTGRGFDDGDLPECVVEFAESDGPMAIVRYLCR